MENHAKNRTVTLPSRRRYDPCGRQRRKILLIGVAWFSVWFSILGPIRNASSANLPSPSGTPRDTLTVCLPAWVESFDPTSHRSRITQMVLKNMFQALTTRDQDLNVVPQLAENWRTVDPVTWEFHLKHGVRFHNGDAFTARDVEFTFSRILDPGEPDGRASPRKELFEPVERVRAVNDYTVRITTRKPWTVLPMMLSLQEIVPERYFKSVGPEGFREAPVGTGPFRFLAQRAGNRLALTRFDQHPDAAPAPVPGGTVPVRNLVFDVVPKKIDQIARLKRGETDLIFGVPPVSVDILKKTPGITVLNRPATRCTFAEINCAAEPFTDRRIRQALNHAVDIRLMVRNASAGYGRALPTVLLPEAAAFNHDLAPYAYDPLEALQLLEAADYPENRPVSVYCNQEDLEIGNILVSFLMRIGLQADLHATTSYRPTMTGASAGWDIFVGSWGNSTLDPVDILPAKFRSDGKGNYSGYRNTEVDRLMDEAECAADPERRTEIYRRVQAIIHEDAPMIFGYAPDEFYGLRERVKNFSPPPTGMFEFDDVHLEERR